MHYRTGLYAEEVWEMLVEQVNILLQMARRLPNARIQRRTPPMLEPLGLGMDIIWDSSVWNWQGVPGKEEDQVTISVGEFCVQFLPWFAVGGPVFWRVLWLFDICNSLNVARPLYIWIRCGN